MSASFHINEELQAVVTVLASEAKRATEVHGRDSIERSRVAYLLCEIARHLPSIKSSNLHYHFSRLTGDGRL
jgi:hypothetical protein